MFRRPWSCFTLLGLLLAALAAPAEAADPLATALAAGNEVPAALRGGAGDGYLVGSPYYLWYPDNFRQGYLRNKLDPAQTPLLGQYDSRDPGVAEQHVAWASQYGLDFFMVDYWPNRPEQNAALDQGLLQADNLSDIDWCIFYETWNLGFDNQTQTTNFSAATGQRLVDDVLDLADRYFDHPDYLRINGRPVVFFYLTRTLTGDYATAFQNLRQALLDRGEDPYFIADEVYWAAADPAGNYVAAPQTQRINLFDAITDYNMYHSQYTQHAGYGAQSSYMSDVAAVYDSYRAAAGEAVDFVPNILPGYNDRGTRPREDHYVIPRQWEEGAAEGSYLSESFSRLAQPYLDPDLNMFTVTSWNEWNEDTSLEPVKGARATRRDISGSGDLYTQGYTYNPYGFSALESLLSAVAAVAGRVVDPAGNPVAGAQVDLSQDGVVVGSTLSDHQGYYVLDRPGLPEGGYEVAVAGDSGGQRVQVELDASGSATGMVLQAQTGN
ncbi:MAG: glycoside hydrolase family 99-like domain-containing protein [Deltaproteobacteria bacterium]|nr:glycoside hydrolase family 99-like domain-containing protein [Deltaproteobacteria bacterium]